MSRALPLLLLALALTGCATVAEKPAPSVPGGPPDGLFAEITTPRGVITCELFFQKAPLTVASFVGLAEGTLGPAPRKPYFDGTTFHRVVPDFVIQGGDPTGTGSGEPGYRFPNEFFAGQRHDGPGVLSMANAGPDTNGSQFFITLGAARYLDFVHPIFGRVIAGGDVPAKIEKGDAMSVKIIRRGRAAQTFRADDQAFAGMLARAKTYPAPVVLDTSPAAPSDAPFQTRYLEYRLTELALFTGRHFYVRLADKFEPDAEAETTAQFVAAQPAKLHLPPAPCSSIISSEITSGTSPARPPVSRCQKLNPAHHQKPRPLPPRPSSAANRATSTTPSPKSSPPSSTTPTQNEHPRPPFRSLLSVLRPPRR